MTGPATGLDIRADPLGTLRPHLTDDNILSTHDTVSLWTSVNVDDRDPTSCGTSGNAVLKILADLYGVPFQNLVPYRRMGTLVDLIEKEVGHTAQAFAFGIGATALKSLWSNATFPGHCFIVWKCDRERYYILQSYFGVYRVTIRAVTRRALIRDLRVWATFDRSECLDRKQVQFWKEFTGVDIRPLQGLTAETPLRCLCHRLDLETSSKVEQVTQVMTEQVPHPTIP